LGTDFLRFQNEVVGQEDRGHSPHFEDLRNNVCTKPSSANEDDVPASAYEWSDHVFKVECYVVGQSELFGNVAPNIA
jgi:hypothetical protein